MDHDESGDGWPHGSASKQAGVAQSPDGRRAITIFDPSLRSSVSLTRAGKLSLPCVVGIDYVLFSFLIAIHIGVSESRV